MEDVLGWGGWEILTFWVGGPGVLWVWTALRCAVLRCDAPRFFRATKIDREKKITRKVIMFVRKLASSI
jgi:hypothetical protein